MQELLRELFTSLKLTESFSCFYQQMLCQVHSVCVRANPHFRARRLRPGVTLRNVVRIARWPPPQGRIRFARTKISLRWSLAHYGDSCAACRHPALRRRRVPRRSTRARSHPRTSLFHPVCAILQTLLKQRRPRKRLDGGPRWMSRELSL